MYLPCKEDRAWSKTCELELRVNKNHFHLCSGSACQNDLIISHELPFINCGDTFPYPIHIVQKYHSVECNVAGILLWMGLVNRTFGRGEQTMVPLITPNDDHNEWLRDMRLSHHLSAFSSFLTGSLS